MKIASAARVVLLALMAIGLFSLVAYGGYAQPPIFPDDPAAPEWVRLMYGENPNVPDVAAAFQAYYETHDFERNTYTQYYKRWLQRVRPLVGKDGFVHVPTPAEVAADQALALDMRGRAGRGAGGRGTWEFIGPSEVFNLKADVGGGPQFQVSWHGNVYGVDVSLSDPNILYCGTESGGLYKTVDKGLNWEMVNAEILSGSIRGIKIHPSAPNTVYFNTSGNVYKSVDGGATWNITGGAIFQSLNVWVHDMAINPADPEIVYLASNSGLYRSTDGGVDWTRVVISQCWTVAIKSDDPDVVYTVQDWGSTSRFYKSTDRGATFFLKDSGWYVPTAGQSIYGVRITVTPANPNKIYALIGGDGDDLNGYVGVFASNDAGESWSHPHGVIGVPYNINSHPNLMAHDGVNGFYQGFYDFAIIVSPNNANRLIIGGTSWWKSNDGGVTYAALGGYVGNLPWSHPDMQFLRAVGNDLWIANDGGLNYSTNFATTHEARNRGISGHEFWGFAAGWNEDVLVGGRYHVGNAAYHESYPQGQFLRMGGAEAATGYVNYGESRKTYFSDIGGRILPENLDGYGSSFSVGKWPNESYISAESSEMEFDPRCWNIVYLGNGNGIWKSEDGGTVFTLLHSFGAVNEPIREIEISRSNPDVLYLIQMVAGGHSVLWKTGDAGATWSQVAGSPVNFTAKVGLAVSATDEDELWVSNWWDDAGQRVWRSGDGGDSWTNLTTSTLNGFKIDCMVHQYGTDGGIYLGTDLGIVFYRNRTMGNWEPTGTGLPVSASTLKLRPFYKKGKLRNGTWDYGIWECDFYESSSPIAQISVDRYIAHSDRDTLQFDDHSVLGEVGATWSWSFPGGTPAVSSLRNPKVTYAAPGVYGVALTVADASGGSSQTLNDLITVTDEANAEAAPGNAVYFDGDAAYAVADSPLDLNSNTVTLSAWIKRQGAQDHYAGIVFCRGGNTGAGLSMMSTGELRYFWNTVGYSVETGLFVPDGVWTHVALVVEPDRVTTYMNGVAYVDPVARGMEEFDAPIRIGSDAISGYRFFRGLIDEVCIYDRSLSRDELREAMHLTKIPSADPSLRTYYQFNEESGAVLDRAGTNHATLADAAFRVVSTGPFGGGASARLQVDGGGIFAFGDTGVEMTFPAFGDHPDGEVVVSRLDLQPNEMPGPEIAGDRYWVLENFGLNRIFSRLEEIRFSDLGVIGGSAADYSLHRRETDGDLPWGEPIAVADAISADAGGEVLFGAGSDITEMGQFVIEAGGTLSSAGGDGTSAEFALGQSFPNPAVPGVNIKFTLPRAEHVTLQLFDSSGRLVETLVSQEMPGGTHLVRWPAATRASGVYFYRLRAGGLEATQKLILMK